MPADLANDVGFIAEYLERLPMGLIRLSPACVRAPWWLVLAAHEVGHTLERDLVSGLHDGFADAVRSAAATKVGDEDAAWWSRWAPEIFADTVSVLLAGPWALRALIELERRSPAEMTVRRPQYPPAYVRLELLERVACVVGLAPGSMLDEVRAEAPPESAVLARDRAALEPVVEASLAELPEVGVSLVELCDVRPKEFERDGTVDQWATTLADGGGDEDGEEQSIPSGSNTRGARLMACATLAAWSALQAVEDGRERLERETALAKRSIQALIASQDGTFRADEPAPPAAVAAGDGLASALLAADELELTGGLGG